MRTVPIQLVGLSENGPATPSRKPRKHTPVRPVIHALIDDENDDTDVSYIIVYKGNIIFRDYFLL